MWLVGSPRTGSTWLVNLLALHDRVKAIDEPLIGAHLGVPMSAVTAAGPGGASTDGARLVDRYAERDGYFFSARYRDSWEPALAALVLARLGAQFADLGGTGRDLLVLKEPHGSEGADLLGAALPASRVLCLVRDGRDTVDSVLDAIRPGAWAHDVATLADDPATRTAFVAEYARLWVTRTGTALRAMEARGDGGLLLRYEDLLSDTEGGLRRIYDWLSLPVPTDLAGHVARLAFDALPAEHRGTGQFARAATPGLWRENLTADEQRIVTDVMGPMLARLGYPL